MTSIYHRVSVRSWKDQPVERDKITEILKAAMQAPSAGNQQPWEFYVIDQPDMLKELAGVSPYAGCTAKAPVAVVAAYRKDCRMPEYAEIDLSIAMENMWLRTDEIGLGGVWLGIAPIEERMRRIEQILSLPENLHAFAIFPLGYPDQEKTQADRFDESRIHYL